MPKLTVPALELAKIDHLGFRDQVKDYFLGLNNADLVYEDHNDCILGIWMNGNEPNDIIKKLPIFKELYDAHKAMHDAILSIIDAKKLKNIKLYESEFRTFSTLADLTIAKIELLDMAIQKLEFNDSLTLARRFQEGICSNNENLYFLKNFGQVDRPVNVVSGDMLWTANKPSHHYIVLIDAVGHGPAASILTTTLATIFSGIFNLSEAPDLLNFKKAVDQFFTSNFGQIVKKENISFDFMMMKIDSEALKMEILSNNRHLATFQDGSWKQIKLDDSNAFETTNIQFAQGQQFAVWTDGLKDLYIENNKRLGNKGIMAFLEDYSGLNSLKLSEHFGKFIPKNPK